MDYMSHRGQSNEGKPSEGNQVAPMCGPSGGAPHSTTRLHAVFRRTPHRPPGTCGPGLGHDWVTPGALGNPAKATAHQLGPFGGVPGPLQRLIVGDNHPFVQDSSVPLGLALGPRCYEQLSVRCPFFLEL